MTADTDRDLALGCLAGEEGAWRQLTTRYADVVYGVAWRCGLRGDDAGDVVQETFLALWKSLGRMQKKERLLAWILQTARRESWRQVRRARAVHRREGRVARSELAEEALPQEVLEELERQQVVRQAFAGLGAKCRRLLDALFFEAEVRPYEEIAVELDMAVGSIGPTRRRCLESLKRLLVAEGFAPADVSGAAATPSRGVKRKRR